MLAAHPPSRRSQPGSPLWDLLRQLEEFQNEYKRIPWGPVRLIKSRQLLVVEQALRCMRSPYTAPFWAYQAAKDYAERYDPHSPHGLVRASTPAIQDMARFWCRQVKPTRAAERSAGSRLASQTVICAVPPRRSTPATARR